MPGAKQVLGKLIRHKVPYFLVSRRKKPLLAIKILKHHGLWPKYFNKTNAFFVLTPEDKNEKSKELVYVIEGNGRIIQTNKEITIQIGDVILLNHNEKFAWEGNMKIFMVTVPKFDPQQHKIIK